ncbi:hypothetical protein B8V81_2104 [Paenibacillus pasadenensis]|uniref:Uncharacterized protein n=1 Tax=Paenibacillus pasadenensis TaxID=217090 RepID=A0A2N5N011_9BACL|nr:hypothetical protein [Paenibacillus pasadenensis]PLT43673.1 hypothetical protein B8V81_2104 [Paenibacillus pasadenensis]
MSSVYRLLRAIQVASFANRLVYYMRRLPWIGSRVPESLYARRGWKRAASWAAIVLELLWAVANKLIYVGLCVVLPALWMREAGHAADPLPSALAILLPLSFFTACLWNARVLEPKRDKFVAVKLMRIPGELYMKATLTYRYVVFFLSFLIALAVLLPFVGGSMLGGALLALSITMWRLAAEYGHLLLFERTGIVLIKKNGLIWASILVGLALAYGPPLLGLAPDLRLPALPAALLAALIALLGAAAVWRLARYPRYREAVEAATRRDDPLLDLGRMMAEAKKADVAVKQDDLGDPGPDRGGSASGSSGYAYLNALFFSRHRRLVRRPLLVRLAIVAGAGAAGCAVLAVLRPQPGSWDPASLAVYLPFGLYLLSVGERICRALFYNCDMPLMRYAFYRAAAPKHFRLRLVRLAAMNLLTGAAAAAALTAAAAVAGAALPLEELLLLWALVLSLALLFSVHHLALYYLLQPYSTELDAKNPLFHFVNMALSAGCWLVLLLRPELPALAAGSALLLALYAAAALGLVSRLGARTFRIK